VSKFCGSDAAAKFRADLAMSASFVTATCSIGRGAVLTANDAAS
jgi:hypothetical protein